MQGVIGMTSTAGDTLEDLAALLHRGYSVSHVDSTETALEVWVDLSDQVQKFHLGREEIMGLLGVKKEIEEPSAMGLPMEKGSART